MEKQNLNYILLKSNSFIFLSISRNFFAKKCTSKRRNKKHQLKLSNLEDLQLFNVLHEANIFIRSARLFYVGTKKER